VNHDGIVAPLDVLIVVNYINAGMELSASAALAAGLPALFVDVDGDFLVDAGDALRIANLLNDATEAAILALEASRFASEWYADADSGAGWLDDTSLWEGDAGDELVMDDAGLLAPMAMPRRIAEEETPDDEGVLLEKLAADDESLVFSDEANWLLPELT
jgi:hypothetical protein